MVVVDSGLPQIHPGVYKTERGTPYLKKSGVVMLSRPHVDLAGMQQFLDGYDLGFGEYIDDPTILTPGAQLCKTAGQLCYLSLGEQRTMNKDAGRYFDNIKSSGHGSVLEAACYSFLFYGISRSCTHELVRHRLASYSQVSQRYVDGSALRFVERPEWSEDSGMHRRFCTRIDIAAQDYEDIAQRLIGKQAEGSEILSGEKKRDLRKKVNQAARCLLPNETEAPIIVTANARAWRHIIEMRASEHAETEIRALGVNILSCLQATDPLLFSDYEFITLPDGTVAAHTDHRKV